MKFEVNRELENNIFNTKIYFVEYGSKDLEPEEEQELINDFGSPRINYSELDFKGKVAMQDDKLVISEKGEKISFVLNAKTLKIDDNFLAELSVNPKKLDFVTVHKQDQDTFEIDEDELILKDNRRIAEAVCVVFEDVIKKEIEEKIKDLKQLYTSFEKDTPIEFIV